MVSNVKLNNTIYKCDIKKKFKKYIKNQEKKIHILTIIKKKKSVPKWVEKNCVTLKNFDTMICKSFLIHIKFNILKEFDAGNT